MLGHARDHGIKSRSGAAERQASREAGSLPWFEYPDWEADFAAALERQPLEPRLAIGWKDLVRYEQWLCDRGFLRVGFGPNGHENGFNVFAQPARVSVPGRSSSWATDEIEGDSNDV